MEKSRQHPSVSQEVIEGAYWIPIASDGWQGTSFARDLLWGFTIALIIHSLDPSLTTQLIAIHSFEGISIALVIHSFDPTLPK